MKKFVRSMAIYIVMILGIYIGEFYGIDSIVNLTAFAAWIFIIVGFVCLAAEPKDLFSNVKFIPLLRLVQYAMIAVMVSVGWIWTGAFYFIASICMHLKYLIYKDEIKKHPHNTIKSPY